MASEQKSCLEKGSSNWIYFQIQPEFQVQTFIFSRILPSPTAQTRERGTPSTYIFQTNLLELKYFKCLEILYVEDLICNRLNEKLLLYKIQSLFLWQILDLAEGSW